MQWAWAQQGLKLPRTTWDQVNVGQLVPKEQAQPGDLLFSNRSGHVSMYLGNNMRVHAPYTGTVVQTGSVDWSKVEGRSRASAVDADEHAAPELGGEQDRRCCYGHRRQGREVGLRTRRGSTDSTLDSVGDLWPSVDPTGAVTGTVAKAGK